MQSVARKITGPREMPPPRKVSGGNGNASANLQVPRKPVAATAGPEQREKSPGKFPSGVCDASA
jgi:hypothetical protein